MKSGMMQVHSDLALLARALNGFGSWRQVCPGSWATVAARPWAERVAAQACRTNPEITWSKAPQVTVQKDGGPAVLTMRWPFRRARQRGREALGQPVANFLSSRQPRSLHAICKSGSFRRVWRPAAGSSSRACRQAPGSLGSLSPSMPMWSFAIA